MIQVIMRLTIQMMMRVITKAAGQAIRQATERAMPRALNVRSGSRLQASQRGPGRELRVAVGLLAAVSSAASLQAQSIVVRDTFEGGINQGQWSYLGGGTSIEPSGGNPDAYIRGSVFNFPSLRTGDKANPFTGNLFERRISEFSLDLVTFRQGSTPSPPFLVFETDNGTPADPRDDWLAYVSNARAIPSTAEGWVNLRWPVPSGVCSAPPSWQAMTIRGDPLLVVDWPRLMRNVTRVRVDYSEPGRPTIMPSWTVGADNIAYRDGEMSSCERVDCDRNCRLDINDFACFQNAYAMGDLTRADCNRDGVLSISDFTCFQNLFALGC